MVNEETTQKLKKEKSSQMEKNTVSPKHVNPALFIALFWVCTLYIAFRSPFLSIKWTLFMEPPWTHETSNSVIFRCSVIVFAAFSTRLRIDFVVTSVVLGQAIAYSYFYYYYSCYSLLSLVLLLHQRWSPPLSLQVSHYNTFRTMCDVPSIAVFVLNLLHVFQVWLPNFSLNLLLLSQWLYLTFHIPHSLFAYTQTIVSYFLFCFL